jgi:hypothetical protein
MFKVLGWIISSRIFQTLEADKALFRTLKRVFTGYDSTFIAAVAVVEVFPEVVNSHHLKRFNISSLKSPTIFLNDIIEVAHRTLERSGLGVRDKKKESS